MRVNQIKEKVHFLRDSQKEMDFFHGSFRQYHTLRQSLSGGRCGVGIIFSFSGKSRER